MPTDDSSDAGIEWLHFTAGAGSAALGAVVADLAFNEAFAGIVAVFPIIWIAQRTEHLWSETA